MSELSQFTTGNLFDVAGRVGLITGGGTGIGLMITKALVANGAKVYIASRRLEVIEAIAAELTKIGPGTCKAIQADLSSKQACENLAHTIAEHEQHLDFLINNSGVAYHAPLEQFPDEYWNQEYRLNVTSVFQLTIACLPLLEASQRQSTDPARVINMGSIAGVVHNPSFDAYSYQSSKAAVLHLSSVLSSHLAGRNINVVSVAPGLFPSDMGNEFIDEKSEIIKSIPQGRIGNETDMGGLALFLCSKASAFINGSTITIDGGSTLWM